MSSSPFICMDVDNTSAPVYERMKKLTIAVGSHSPPMLNGNHTVKYLEMQNAPWLATPSIQIPVILIMTTMEMN
jgi:hypothetical protein